MKHFELVDKIFNQDSSAQNSNVDVNLLSSDQEDELHFSFNHDQESDASNSCTGNDSVIPQTILPGPSYSPLLERENSPVSLKLKPPLTPSSAHNDSNDTLLNGEQNYDCSDKDSPIDDSESPWVPNVVLVENDLESGDLDNASENEKTRNLNGNERLEDFQNADQTESSFKEASEPPQKRRKQESTHKWLKTILDSVTDKFLKYQESTESRFLEQITCLEQERMKRDESMHKLWMEFEERRRKEEQQHELKMISLLGQFVHQMNENGNHDSK
ncbi:uncharacterized protein LOC118179973 [Stegodyphus dumicola]|uniref:uncharacterized protein LOC118179973 n=1 Tax=Stegodyphus dumicola TaxID=202533 RepID=UPI0015AF1F77|nr:uncharacterized protein LOC118179973 [Stegodyphus dumicola]